MAKLALNNYTITGEFGEVYKAHLTGFSKQGKSRLVAVKTLRGMVNISPFCDFLVDLTLFTTTGLFNANDVQQILQEVVKMKDFKHPHVMPLIGVCLDSGVGVVMPFMANSSVLSYLKKERDALLLSEDADIEQVL